MPTTYAHWRFGCDCIETLPENLKKAVNDHREIFDFGVHGPDIFFYDLSHPKIAKYGTNMHHEPAKPFFERCIEVYKENEEDKDAMMAYMLGFLSHYTLDSQCHPYINKKDEVTPELSHNKIESEYDAHMMKLDGRSINLTDRAQSLVPKKEDAAIIARFFPFSAKDLYRVCRMHHMIIHALNCKSDMKRNTLTGTLNALHLYDFRDLPLHNEEHPLAKDSNLRIDKDRANALEYYPELVEALMKAIDEDAPLPDYFNYNFGPDIDVPVLSYEEELNYIPEKVR